MFLPMIMGAVLLFFGRYMGVPDQTADLTQRCAALEQEKVVWLNYVAQLQPMLSMLQASAAQNRELVASCLKISEQLLTMERSSYDQINQLAQLLDGKQ